MAAKRSGLTQALDRKGLLTVMSNSHTANAPKRYGKNLLLGGLIAIFSNMFLLGTPELATGIRNGGAIMVATGALIWLVGHARSRRAL